MKKKTPKSGLRFMMKIWKMLKYQWTGPAVIHLTNVIFLVGHALYLNESLM